MKTRLLSALVALSLVQALAAQPPAVFTFLTFNDTYELEPQDGKGGMAEMATVLKAERAKARNHLTTVNGDFISPSMMSSFFKGAQMVDLFDEIGVDVVVLGNHEFDLGWDALADRVAQSRFRWLGTNTSFSEGRFSRIEKSMSVTADGVTVGLIGLVVTSVEGAGASGGPAVFNNPLAIAKAAVRELRQAGADTVVALTHLGIREDCQIAKEVPEISLMLGGHDHEPMAAFGSDDVAACVSAARAKSAAPQGDGTLILKSGMNSELLGVVDLSVSKREAGPAKTSVSWRWAPVEKVVPDAAAAAKVSHYTSQLDQKLSKPIGKTLTRLDSRKELIRSEETATGNLIADALRESLRADASIVNGGGIRANKVHEPGAVLTRKDIIAELPFPNTAVLLELRGQHLLEALEAGLSRVESKGGSFPHVSGLKIIYDVSQPPGRRVVSAEINGRPISPMAFYRIATIDYLAKGNGGYGPFRQGRFLISPEEGGLFSTVVADYIEAKGDISPRVEGRVKPATP
ncbi:MAG: bifunctional metallophosphatase/5'-nucleotidase [Elusimicrobia bacterium]|nr:bifunctional metallophosphatase/5'-nucleotidase [Elusimicrobiota bacterium]